MKIIKNILIGLGAVFLLLVGLVVFLASESVDFHDKHSDFVQEFTRVFSEDWDISSVSDSMSNGMLSQIDTTEGRRAMEIFRSLGAVVSITDFEMSNYYSSATDNANTGTFQFKAKFQRGDALVTVTVLESDDKVRIHAFNIQPIGDLAPSEELEV